MLSYKTRIVQFGEGRFLRAFMEDMLEHANRTVGYGGSVFIVKPRKGGSIEQFANHNNSYELRIRGRQGGEIVDEKKIIHCISGICRGSEDYQKLLELAGSASLKLVVSNTTEAGITFDLADKSMDDPPGTYPGKLTAFLYRRFEAFAKAGDAAGGLVIMPLELNENNGGILRDCVLKYAEHWGLPVEFVDWITSENIFCSTLVDRIVTGGEQGLSVTAEPYGSLIIETDQREEVLNAFPFDKCGINVTFTDDIRPYREQKVRLLNGVHTSICLTGMMLGLRYVDECMAHPLMRAYIDMLINDEIIPTIRLPRETVMMFADSVIERFENPFLHHQLKDIALNSVSKWKTRILPTVMDYKDMRGELPEGLMLSLASLMVFYEGAWKECGIGSLQDEDDSLEIIETNRMIEDRTAELKLEIKREGLEKTLMGVVRKGG